MVSKEVGNYFCLSLSLSDRHNACQEVNYGEPTGQQKTQWGEKDTMTERHTMQSSRAARHRKSQGDGVRHSGKGSVPHGRGAEVRCPKRTGHPMGINQSAQPTQARPRERSELPEPRSGESEALKTTHNTD